MATRPTFKTAIDVSSDLLTNEIAGFETNTSCRLRGIERRYWGL